MKGWAVLALALALGLTIALLVWQGWREVADALALAGWGLLLPAPLYLVSLVPASLAWRALFPPGRRPPFHKLMVASWLGQSVNWLLPVAQVGGDAAKAVWLHRACPELDGASVAASAIVDKTLQGASQALIAWIGIGLLVWLFPNPILIGVSVALSLLLCLGLGVFIQLQRRGLIQNLVARASRKEKFAWLRGLVGRAEAFDEALKESYRRPRDLVICVAWRLLSRLAFALELLWILSLLGLAIGLDKALFLECLGQTVRAASFLVPGSYGIQEGGFVFLGRLLNISGDLALALALGKRVRELLVGVPALLLLQASIGFSFLKRSPEADCRSEATPLSVQSDTPGAPGPTFP